MAQNKKSINQPIEVVDQREKLPFYMIHNIFIESGVAAFVTPFGTAVYNSILFHADKNMLSWPSIDLISKEQGMSPKQVSRSIKLLEKYKIITVIRDQGFNNKYLVNNSKYWQLTTDSQTGVNDPTTDSQTVPPRTDSPPSKNHITIPISISHEKDDFKEIKPHKNKPAKIGSQVNYLEEINKRLTEYDQGTQLAIKLFLDGVTSCNKSGGMTQRRYLTLLCELGTVSVTTSKEAFKNAVQKAGKNGASSIAYIKAILERDNKTQLQKQDTTLFDKQDNTAKPGYTLDKGQWCRIDSGNCTRITEDQVPQAIRERVAGKCPTLTPVKELLPSILSRFNMLGHNKAGTS